MIFIIFVIYCSLFFGHTVSLITNTTLKEKYGFGKCGIDKSRINVVYPGVAKIETYPWLGVLYYPAKDHRYTTTVVLVTKQIVIASAMDIDKLPKTDFRARTRVVLGGNCSNPGIGVKEYSYHPDFNTLTYSALALVQLETNYKMTYLHPICPPPKVLNKPQVYAFTIDDCENSNIKIHKMAYVDLEKCRTFYRKSELNDEKIWPTNTICARALTSEKCIWRNGAVLALRQNNKWSMVGFGVFGPGCRATSRFMEYSEIKPWVSKSISRIGMPTVTRTATNEIILRRTTSSLQRYGICDPEEIKAELFTDRTTIEQKIDRKRIHRASYNFTIFSTMEYSCVVFRVDYHYKQPILREMPYLRLKRWCLTDKPICYSSKILQIDFAIDIFFKESITYTVMVYGRKARFIDKKRVMAWVNRRKPYPVVTKMIRLTK